MLTLIFFISLHHKQQNGTITPQSDISNNKINLDLDWNALIVLSFWTTNKPFRQNEGILTNFQALWDMLEIPDQKKKKIGATVIFIFYLLVKSHNDQSIPSRNHTGEKILQLDCPWAF